MTQYARRLRALAAILDRWSAVIADDLRRIAGELEARETATGAEAMADLIAAARTAATSHREVICDRLREQLGAAVAQFPEA
jgi:hypothetical protein